MVQKATKEKPQIRLKRVYQPPSKEDGFRILVDRIWPRGLTKDRADVHLWLKEAAPSAELRKWFGHEVSRWKEFKRKYTAELKQNPEAISQLRQHLKDGQVTLLFGAGDEEHNQAVVLKEFLEEN